MFTMFGRQVRVECCENVSIWLLAEATRRTFRSLSTRSPSEGITFIIVVAVPRERLEVSRAQTILVARKNKKIFGLGRRCRRKIL